MALAHPGVPASSRLPSRPGRRAHGGARGGDHHAGCTSTGSTCPPTPPPTTASVILGGNMNAYADDRCRAFPGPARTRPRLCRRRASRCSASALAANCSRAPGVRRSISAPPRSSASRTLSPTAGSHAPTRCSPARPRAPAMQWHDDTFDMPAGAVPLLTGTACRNQAFRVADVVWGFQCHFEADRRDMVDWAEYRRDVYGYDDFVARLAGRRSRARRGRRGIRAQDRRPLARSRRGRSRAWCYPIDPNPWSPAERLGGAVRRS